MGKEKKEKKKILPAVEKKRGGEGGEKGAYCSTSCASLYLPDWPTGERKKKKKCTPKKKKGRRTRTTWCCSPPSSLPAEEGKKGRPEKRKGKEPGCQVYLFSFFRSAVLWGKRGEEKKRDVVANVAVAGEGKKEMCGKERRSLLEQRDITYDIPRDSRLSCGEKKGKGGLDEKKEKKGKGRRSERIPSVAGSRLKKKGKKKKRPTQKKKRGEPIQPIEPSLSLSALN